MQSRDATGADISSSDDFFNIAISNGVSTAMFTAYHIANGLYGISFIPTIAGAYTVTIDMTNE